jgi:hypothetical protein
MQVRSTAWEAFDYPIWSADFRTTTAKAGENIGAPRVDASSRPQTRQALHTYAVLAACGLAHPFADIVQ